MSMTQATPTHGGYKVFRDLSTKTAAKLRDVFA